MSTMWKYSWTNGRTKLLTFSNRLNVKLGIYIAFLAIILGNRSHANTYPMYCVSQMDRICVHDSSCTYISLNQYRNSANTKQLFSLKRRKFYALLQMVETAGGCWGFLSPPSRTEFFFHNIKYFKKCQRVFLRLSPNLLAL